MSEELPVFYKAANRFLEKYGERLGEHASAGAVITGILAEILRCDCGGVRVPFEVIETGETRFACPTCHGEWRILDKVDGEQIDMFEE